MQDGGNYLGGINSRLLMNVQERQPQALWIPPVNLRAPGQVTRARGFAAGRDKTAGRAPFPIDRGKPRVV